MDTDLDSLAKKVDALESKVSELEIIQLIPYTCKLRLIHTRSLFLSMRMNLF